RRRPRSSNACLRSWPARRFRPSRSGLRFGSRPRWSTSSASCGRRPRGRSKVLVARLVEGADATSATTYALAEALMKTTPPRHGMGRGLRHVPRSPSFEGRFGRMFRSLPAAEFRPEILAQLAKAMTAEREDPPTPETQRDAEENTGISAGITYLGQFIDHDLTFDPTSSLQKQNDPDALVDFRSPRFDLDSVYGRGPDDQPYLYAPDGVRMLLGRRLTGSPKDPRARDVPRSNPAAGPKRAIIGDPRNDENVIIAQLHAVFMRFHNRVADHLK